MKKILILFITIIGLVSCDMKNERVKTVKVENKYSLSIPTFLSKTNDLNDDASLKYQNIFQEFYVVVMDETKNEFHKVLEERNLFDKYSNDLKGYSDILIADLENENLNFKKYDEIDTIINNLPAKIITFSVNNQGVDVFTSTAYIEGKENYYQIFTWTIATEETKHKYKMEEIIYSFKEL